MFRLGYTLSSEEHGPKELVQFAAQAENAGFAFAVISDHYNPWLFSQNNAPFAYSVIGAISQVTSQMEIGVGVTCPLIRYHPTIIAQASATCAILLDHRFFLGLGTGENLNEHIVGEGWPPIAVRQQMLIEAVEIIRALHRGQLVNYYGQFFTVDGAQIWSLPSGAIPLIISGYGPVSATIAGELGDGFISVVPSQKLIRTFEEAGGAGKVTYGQIDVCFNKSEEKSQEIAYQYWANTALKGSLNTELRLTQDFQKASAMVKPEDMQQSVVLGSNTENYIKKILEYKNAGFNSVYLHQIGPDQREFFTFVKEELLPYFKEDFDATSDEHIHSFHIHRDLESDNYYHQSTAHTVRKNHSEKKSKEDMSDE